VTDSRYDLIVSALEIGILFHPESVFVIILPLFRRDASILLIVSDM
jgi:hypothetical protein